MNTLRTYVQVLRVRPESGSFGFYRTCLKLLLRKLLWGQDVAFNALVRGTMIVRYDHLRFVVNSETGLGPLFINMYEPLAYSALESISGEIFVDIGANVGAFCIRLADRFSHVLAVEPNPIAASILRENIRLNSIDNTEVLEEAVTKTSGTSRLYKTQVISTWTLEGGASQDYVEVRTLTLDELLYPYATVDALKVDAEGAEIGILEGGRAALKKVRTIVIEARSSNAAVVEDLLRQSGFVTKNLDAESGIVMILGKRK